MLNSPALSESLFVVSIFVALGAHAVWYPTLALGKLGTQPLCLSSNNEVCHDCTDGIMGAAFVDLGCIGLGWDWLGWGVGPFLLWLSFGLA